MKTIRLLFVLGFILTVFSCDKDDDVELSSFDVVKETINPSYTTADIVCEFSTRATVKNVFVQYSKNVDFSDYEEQKMVEKDGKFSVSLSALQWNTTYYIRYAAKNSYSSAVTEKISEIKTLKATCPTINIEQISNVLDKTASVEIALGFDGGVAVSEYGVCLNSNATPTVDGYHVVANNEQTTISLSGLKENTTYRMRAYAKNEIGVGYSKQFSFTTLDLPKVRTDEFSDIQLFSVRLHATAVSTGNDTTATFGFCWAEQTNPTIENNSTKVAVEKDTFSYLLSNLEDETTYYVRAYAKNKIGVVYGEEKSFTTQPVVKPTVSTTAATNILYISVTVGGNVTSDGGTIVTERGICYSTSQNPTITNNKVISGNGIGSFTCNLTNLQDGTTYYARAYATNSKGTSYGEQISFKTTSHEDEYVDLGLSVKWATCNVGATKPEEYGSYFAWGETTPKTTYVLRGYKWCGSDYKLTKYCTDSDDGTVDNKTVLDPEDDAAAVKMGGSWRMPTYDELEELKTKCTWTWTTQNGKKGYLVTSKTNGNAIFLPAAGYRHSRLDAAGSGGYYWSSSLNTGNPECAYYLRFNSGNVYWESQDHDRSCGHSVRGVCPY